MQENENIQNNNITPTYQIPEITSSYSSNNQNNQVIPNYEHIQSEVLDQNINNTDNIINDETKEPNTNNYNQINNNEQKMTLKQNYGNQTEVSSFEIISFISWILFISSKWNSYIYSVNTTEIKMANNYRTLLYDTKFYDLISLLMCISGFLIYMIHLIYKKNNNLFKGLFGQISKYHFIPLILYSIINMMKEAALYAMIEPDPQIRSEYYKYIPFSDAFDPKALFTFFLIFNIFTLFSFIFVYMKTEMNCEWYIVMTIKKGIYSILILECWFQIFESIYYLRFMDVYKDEEAKNDFMKSAGIFLILILGGGAIIFSFIFKNITVLFFNLIIYLGMIIAFYGMNKQTEKIKELLNGNTEGILLISILVCDFVFIFVMIFKFKGQLLES